ncbi:shTK domain protein, partial [Ostertagia ostertagi]
MTASCKASCGVCTPNYNISAECSDRSSTCPTTAAECQSRKDWMKENCRRSCSFCDQTRQQACT